MSSERDVQQRGGTEGGKWVSKEQSDEKLQSKNRMKVLTLGEGTDPLKGTLSRHQCGRQHKYGGECELYGVIHG